MADHVGNSKGHPACQGGTLYGGGGVRGAKSEYLLLKSWFGFKGRLLLLISHVISGICQILEWDTQYLCSSRFHVDDFPNKRVPRTNLNNRSLWKAQSGIILNRSDLYITVGGGRCACFVQAFQSLRRPGQHWIISSARMSGRREASRNASARINY